MKHFSLSTKIKSCLVGLTVLGLTACGDSKPAPPENTLGKEVFTKTCKVCHASGINGAPIFGNKKQWSKRIPQGIPTLVEHASNGYGLMPAKGGNTSLTTEEITAAVTYMVGQAK